MDTEIVQESKQPTQVQHQQQQQVKTIPKKRKLYYDTNLQNDTKESSTISAAATPVVPGTTTATSVSTTNPSLNSVIGSITTNGNDLNNNREVNTIVSTGATSSSQVDCFTSDLSEWIGHRILAKNHQQRSNVDGYSPGVITDFQPATGLSVTFDGDAQTVNFSPTMISNIIVDSAPSFRRLKIGKRIAAKRCPQNGVGGFVEGSIESIINDGQACHNNKSVYKVRFNDTGVETISRPNIRLLLQPWSDEDEDDNQQSQAKQQQQQSMSFTNKSQTPEPAGQQSFSSTSAGRVSFTGDSVLQSSFDNHGSHHLSTEPNACAPAASVGSSSGVSVITLAPSSSG